MTRGGEDPRRWPAYRAEWEAFPEEPERPLAELQTFLDDILVTGWFRERWGGPYPRIADGRGSEWARHSDGTFQLPQGTRYRYVVVHELAHWCDPTAGEDHGPVFASLYLYLAGRVCGKYRKGRLAAAFRRHKVPWDGRITAKGWVLREDG